MESGATPDGGPRISPLDDVTVLDLTVALAGPVATLLLAGLGARVIKIENPAEGDPCRNNPPYFGAGGLSLVRERDDDVSLSAANRLRNKLGVTLNLKNPRARLVFADLARKADLIVENFSPGTLSRLGVGYDFARKANPRIVYCAITGFGGGPGGGSGKALDTTIQALSGIMNVSGEEGEPPMPVGLPVADLTASLFGVIGVLAALHQARRTGLGQYVDVSMLGSLTALVASEPYEALERCGAAIRTGQTLQRLAPFGVYPTSDGYVAICAYTDSFAHSLFKIMGQPQLVSDERFGTRDERVKHFRELNELIEAWTSRLATAEIVAKLQEANIPAGEVRGPGAAVRDPRVVSRRDTVPLFSPVHGTAGDIYGMGLPVKFSAATTGFDAPSPALGQHNQAVYGGILGYDAALIEELRREGVI